MNQHELERTVLGGLMISESGWDRGGHLLREYDFTDLQHLSVFRAIKELVTAGTRPDTVTVAEHLEGGLTHRWAPLVAEISNTSMSAANIEAHAKLLRDATVRRQIKAAGYMLQNLTGSAKEQLTEVDRIITDLENTDPREPRRLGESLPDWMKAIEERGSGSGIVGRRLGFSDVDRRLGGMRPGDLIVLAGRPSMGKTALALKAAAANCTEDQTTLVFSLEMDGASLMDRMVAQLATVNMGEIRTTIRDESWPKITAATATIYDYPFYLDDEPALTIQEIHSRARTIKRKHGLGIVMVDYIQLVETDRRHTSRRDHVAEVSRHLKRMAKDLQVPVIALCQLNRKCEDRIDKRPIMSDLFESGAIEQDADAIGFLYRDEVYNPDSERAGICELIWRKVRNGAPGTDYLIFKGQTQEFHQADRASIPPLTKQKSGLGAVQIRNPYKRSGT